MKCFVTLLFTVQLVSLSAWEVSVYPYSYIAKQFELTAEEFQWRWDKYGADQNFSLWSPDMTKDEVDTEFRQLHKLRFSTWYLEDPGWYDCIAVNEDFLFADSLFFGDHFRTGNSLAYAYNNTHPSYNSSNIVIGPYTFLAMEGTRLEEEVAFFHLLAAYQVTHLVRLTPCFDKEEKCHPYWVGRAEETDTEVLLNVPLRGGSTYSLSYYPVEDWIEHQPIDPHRLIALVKEIRLNYNSGKDLIAVHCSSGVGRTGTFIAAYILMSEMDRQHEAGEDMHISIEELVFKLSLQRKYMVGRPSLYNTLYEVVRIYREMQLQSDTSKRKIT